MAAPFHVQLKKNWNHLKKIFRFWKILIVERRIPDWQLIKCDSYIERRLYQALKREGYRVKTQYRIRGYDVDIVIPRYRLAIECDGRQWHRSSEQKKRDRRKSAKIAKAGWKVMRFTGKEINNNIARCIQKVNDYTGKY
ncbi:endonuclease domain-containing protein [Thermoflavimicrobium dichotomicum]|uniref:Restriction endonuclease type II-like domain-containing protein n=1 Tax=Thermoflavimicrobium dichotomicum TaxID=46223 RepID=A0A1I3PBY3_9BACL|nr:DUF559 domain-containing protein [Thermoflavimicrobium dichotomicum]SFJ18556.1 Protein of unknown function [Thermoflavimicrobium dichotomicum]